MLHRRMPAYPTTKVYGAAHELSHMCPQVQWAAITVYLAARKENDKLNPVP